MKSIFCHKAKAAPPAANTLRFEFGNQSYSPVTAGVGSSGTWKKCDWFPGNVWDWTNESTSWASAFYISGNDGCFMDYENNPVKVIAAGDTSSVTDFSRCFSWCTAITEICSIDTSNATTVFLMFNQLHNCTKFPDMDFSSATDTRAVYQCCYKMKAGPSIVFPSDHTFQLTYFFLDCSNIETIPLYNTEQCTDMTAMFQNNMSLKTVPSLVTSNVKSMHHMFKGCVSLQHISSFNFSKVTRFESFASSCTSLTEILEMNIEANVTRCDLMFSNCPNIKSGQKALYDKLSQIDTITNHVDCFKDCGSDTEEGRAELAQIPVSWGGTKEEA